jgi:hypothetical protein
MITIKDIHTVEDVENLTNEEMFYIDKQNELEDFNNEDVIKKFASEWVVRGL